MMQLVGHTVAQFGVLTRLGLRAAFVVHDAVVGINLVLREAHVQPRIVGLDVELEGECVICDNIFHKLDDRLFEKIDEDGAAKLSVLAPGDFSHSAPG